MPKTAKDLIDQYKELYNSIPEHRSMERSACVLYVSIFERLARKDRLGKAAKFIRDDFYVQDNKRLQFAEDSQTDDAYLCAQIQQAYRIYWTEVLDLPLAANLRAKKYRLNTYPMDLSPPPRRYMGAMTGRTKS